MPVTYHCDNCEMTATSLDGWYSVVVGFFYDAEVSGPPGGRILQATNPQLVFHDESCRNAWCEKAAVEPPPPAPAPEVAPETP